MGVMHQRLSLCVAIAWLLISCGSADRLSTFEGLEQRVSDYYSLEQRNDWGAAYEFRTQAFRNSVPKDRYVSLMAKDNRGWRLMKYTIKSQSMRDGRVHLKVLFVESPPADFFKDRVPPGSAPTELEVEDESIWIKEAGSWYAYAPGTRMRLPLNAALVP